MKPSFPCAISRLALVALLSACSRDGALPNDIPSQCEAKTQGWSIEGAGHLPTCSAVSYGTTPPSSGDHYNIWAAYRTFERQVPAGFLVHNLEHGAVVIHYRCPEGCADEVSALKSWMDRYPADPACGPGVKRRFILAPDSSLSSRFAAAAWGWTWTADCLDTLSLNKFIAAHYGRAPEDVCADGVDLSPQGWCP